MFIQFRIKIAKDNEKAKLSDLGIDIPLEEEELEEVIVEVNAFHIVAIEPYGDGYITSLTNGTDLFTTYHPFKTETGSIYN